VSTKKSSAIKKQKKILTNSDTAQRPVKVEIVFLGIESKFSVQDKQPFKKKNSQVKNSCNQN